ncbi:hypothetical protein DERP_005444 [Dermatophagoides pteronyssinus]|uniref:Uncharacterized protein n=1 Tax=Dermatophagoides pteronyssinus TaxID=6956 RepID=A0ABQ8JML6_DERPT|nr:hypothetical protein DERP_005444 [Dermatophagoides pteronyssinus]
MACIVQKPYVKNLYGSHVGLAIIPLSSQSPIKIDDKIHLESDQTILANFQISVNITESCLRIQIVCSNCADRQSFSLATVHPSSNITTLADVSNIIGSINYDHNEEFVDFHANLYQHHDHKIL